MDQKTQLMFTQLVQAQEQINLACTDKSETCVTDMRYAQEWEGLRDYVDTAVMNIRMAAEQYPPEYVQEMIAEVMHQLVPAGNALLEGYLNDLANCTECYLNPCPLRKRAQEALEVRRMLMEEHSGQVE